MREIKFRAWDVAEKKMYENVGMIGTLVILEYSQGGYDFYEIELKSYDHHDEKVKVMQYTGLKDKNGKEIYEGDIVQFYRHSDITHRHEKTDVSIIRFYLGSFVFDAKHVENRPLCNLWRPGESMEVIGNIYEHPHLLKGEENA